MIYRTAPFSMILNDLYPGFKVTPFFDGEYLINGTTYRHSFNEIPIGTYTRPTQQCHFEWSWVNLSVLAKHSMTRSVARFLCDSWASCSLRYGDISIFKMAAVRHLRIVLQLYEINHEVTAAGRSCLSNFMSTWYTQIWRYSYLNFSHIWLKMPIQAPKIGVLGDYGPLNVIIHHRNLKRHILA